MNKFACGKSVLRICAKGFTLSEVMIVLVVIGVITGILLPTAIQSTPDENVMKFKKGYSTLGQVIRELVTSDKYYKDGDLGTRADGNKLKSANIGDVNYFCYTFADALNIKEINCNVTNTTMNGALLILNKDEESTDATEFYNCCNGRAREPEKIHETKSKLDKRCLRNIAKNYHKQIVTADGIWYYDQAPAMHFGIPMGNSLRVFSPPNQYPANIRDENGFDTAYKVFCMDIDGIPENATEDNCINECPFGFGIRADGKILPGARADEWINKSIQRQ